MEYKYEVVKFPQNIPAKIWNQNMRGHEMYTPAHWHRSVEIDLILEGQMVGIVNGKTHILKAGDFLFVNSGELHETTYEERTDYLIGVTILISYEYITKWFPDYGDFYFSLPKEEIENVARICREIGVIYERKEAFYELRTTTLLHDLLYLLFTKALAVKQNSVYLKQQKKFDKVRTAIDYMNQNFKEEITLDALSALSGFAPAYFSRYFKQQTGTTFYTYLNHVRLHYALLDLLQKNASTTECALNNGFPNVKSFIEMFKKVYDCTPGQYKKEYLSANLQQILDS